MDQTMDSLWFFGNVFSSSSTILGPIKHLQGPVEEEWSKPMSAIVQNQQIEPPIEAEISIPVCPKFDEPEILKLDWEKVAVEVDYYNSPSPSPSPEKERGRRSSSSRRSRRGMQRQRRKILGELHVLDFDDHVKEVVSGGWSSNWMAGIEVGNCGFNQRFGDQQQQQQEMNTMPSISDDMAMKEHLKSWAYAVACTVR